MMNTDDLILISTGIDVLVRAGHVEEAEAIKRLASHKCATNATTVRVTPDDLTRAIPNRTPAIDNAAHR